MRNASIFSGIEILSVVTEDVVEMLHMIMVQLPWLFVIWMTVVGGVIGSFLNVVVYRMPAGISISRPPSRCPKCETPIRAYDNIPVLGWLVLRGKCRNCKLSISARYPLVEATVAVLFGILAFVTVTRTHANADVLIVFLRFLYYANAVACLVALSLIDFDGHRFPRRLVLYSCLTILVPPMIRDDVRIWAMPNFLDGLPADTSRVVTVSSVVLHAAWPAFVALCLSWRMRHSPNLVTSGALVGVLLGWLAPALPLVIVSVVSSCVVGLRAKSEDDDSVADGERRRLFTSPVVVLASLAYVFVVVQLYRGGIVYY